MRKSLTFFTIFLTLIFINHTTSIAIKLNADLIIYPSDDTFVSVGGGDLNGVRIYISIGPEIGFLKFPVEQIIHADNATLEMRNISGEILKISIFGVANDVWDEITLSDAADLSASTGRLDEVSIIGNGWYHWNVTDFVNLQTDGWVTFRLVRTEGPGYWLGNSKEGSSGPLLSINGTVHTEDIPALPIYSPTTTTETIYPNPVTITVLDPTTVFTGVTTKETANLASGLIITLVSVVMLTYIRSNKLR